MTNLTNWLRQKLEAIKERKYDDDLCINWGRWNDDKEHTAVWIIEMVLAKLEEGGRMSDEVIFGVLNKMVSDDFKKWRDEHREELIPLSKAVEVLKK